MTYLFWQQHTVYCASDSKLWVLPSSYCYASFWDNLPIWSQKILYIYCQWKTDVLTKAALTTRVSTLKSNDDISESSNASKIWMRYFWPFSSGATPGWSGKNRSMREQLYRGLSTDFQRDLRSRFYWVIPGLTLCCPEATPVKWKRYDLICSLVLLRLEETILSVSLQVCIIVCDLFWQLN